MKRVIIDTDMLADDALALLLAFACPELTVEAISCVGGRDDVRTVGENASRVLGLVGGLEVPVALGVDHGITTPRGFSRSIAGQPSPWNRLHGRILDVLPPARSSFVPCAVDFIISLVNKYPEEITLILLGPLSNIALCVLKDPSFGAKVRGAVVMGGAAFVPGNSTPAAETNIYADPEAARIVLHSGMRITLVGLDVTTKVLMRAEHVQQIRTRRRPAVEQFIAAVVEESLPYQRSVRKLDGFPMHDPLTTAVAVNPSLVRTEAMYVDVETRGELTRGATIPDPRRVWGRDPNVNLCVDVESETFLSFFIGRINQAY
jgi:inosine-uridine nucleoside N-ribohydrolase